MDLIDLTSRFVVLMQRPYSQGYLGFNLLVEALEGFHCVPEQGSEDKFRAYCLANTALDLA